MEKTAQDGGKNSAKAGVKLAYKTVFALFFTSDVLDSYLEKSSWILGGVILAFYRDVFYNTGKEPAVPSPAAEQEEDGEEGHCPGAIL